MSYKKDTEKIFRKIDSLAKLGSDAIFDYFNYVDQLLEESKYSIFEDVLYTKYQIKASSFTSYQTMKRKTFELIRQLTNSSFQEKLKKIYDNKSVYPIGYHYYDSTNNAYLGDIIEIEESQNWIAYKDTKLIEKTEQVKIINLEASVGNTQSINQAVPTFETNIDYTITYYNGNIVLFQESLYQCINSYTWSRNNQITPTYSNYWDTFISPTYSTQDFNDDGVELLTKYSQAIDWLKSQND